MVSVDVKHHVYLLLSTLSLGPESSFPNTALDWNSSSVRPNVCMIDDGPFSSGQAGASFTFYGCLLQAIDG